MTAATTNQLDQLDIELETVLTSFDSSYVWNYGNVKEGMRELYEKAKRDQWNSTTQLAWETEVDPEGEILPSAINPLADYAPFEPPPEEDSCPSSTSTSSRIKGSEHSSCSGLTNSRS